MIALNPKSPGGITSAMVSADELHTLAEMAEQASREAAAAQADSCVGGMIDSPFAKQCAAERAAEQKNNGGTS